MKEKDITKIDFQNTWKLLWVPGYAIWPNQCPINLSIFDESGIQAFLRKFVLVFFDDILVYSKSLSDHILHLGTVLEILATHKLYAKRSKCMFSCKEVEYLGHVITSKRVHTDPKKTVALQQWPIANYYRKFVKGYSQIATPLTALLKNDSFS